MTDNPEWQPGQPPPPPNDLQQPYAGASGPPAGSPQQGQTQGNWQGQPQGNWQGQPQGGAWQGQPQGNWQGQPAHAGNQSPQGDERTWMILAHLSAPVAFIVSAGWLTILGPLLVWLFKKEDSPAVRQAAAGAFNFNLAFWLMSLIGWICIITIILIPVGIIILIVAFLVAAYTHLRGAWLASKGQVYTYPFQVRVLS